MNINPGRIDKYELQEPLGQSGITEVWKAFDTQAHRYVVIKFLRANLQTDPDFVARFKRETQIIASLHHPNIVQYYDFSTSQIPGMGSSTAYIVIDYVEGGTLANYTRNASREGKLLPIADIVRLFTSIGMAVEYAHQHGVIHGDIKPANILLDKRNISRNAIGEPIVTDFGMARLLGADGSARGWWNSAPFYVSPEQLTGSPATERSDIYSLGIMLYEFCTGTLPFLGSSPDSIMMQHVNTIPASPALVNPNLPPALTTIIMRSIAKDPSLRFPTASSLVAALADAVRQGEKQAVDIPVPGNVGQSANQVNAMDMPTVLSTRQSPLPAGMTPSSPGISGVSFPLSPLPPTISGSGGQAAPYYYTPPPYGSVGASSPDRPAMGMPVAGLSQPHPAVQTGGGPGTPLPPVATPAYPAQNFPVGGPVSPPTAPASKKPGRRGLMIALIAVLLLAIVAIVGSSLGAYLVFFSQGSSSTAPTIVGHAYFASSGLLSPDSRQGITDELQINLENVPAPQPGKSYYAWLLNDITMDWRPILLGPLTVDHGTINLFYAGDALHSDLLAINSRFLITQEDAGLTPANPSLNPAAWLYYAEFSQKKPNPADPKSYSVYDHIRHLLAEDPKVKAAGLTGGLDIWLYRDTQKILEWAGSARDFWKYQNAGSSAFIHRQLTRILDYLDGSSWVQKDLPGQSLLVDPTIAKVPLLTFDPQTQDPPGYLYHVGKHLHELTLLPQTTAEQKALAIQINQAIDGVNLWMRTIHDDALKLYHMTDAQLFGSDGLALLDSMATLANTAFAGQVNPHAQVTDGVVQIHYNIQRLATFDVRACTASNPCAL